MDASSTRLFLDFTMIEEIRHSHVSGQLFRLRTGEHFMSAVQRLDGMTLSRDLEMSGWHLFNWKTDSEITINTNVDKDLKIPHSQQEKFTYPLIIREVDERFMVLSNHSEVVVQFLSRHNLTRQLEKPVIDVASIVKDAVNPESALEKRGGQYRIGALYANVEGFGRSVRTISLFGDDLANAAMTRAILPHLSPYRASLRDVRTDSEVISVSAKGEISFYHRGKESLEQVEQALLFMRKSSYIAWRNRT